MPRPAETTDDDPSAIGRTRASVYRAAVAFRRMDGVFGA